MTLSRRQLLAATGAACLWSASRLQARMRGVKIGVTDWNLKQTGKVEAVALAKRLDFEGVQISLGRTPVDGKLPLDNPDTIAQYLAASKEHGIPLDSTCLDILHVNYLKKDSLGQHWVSDGIRITQQLGAKIMLLPFFGEGAIKKPEEQAAVAAALKEVSRAAEKAGVILGLENTISAEENVKLIEQAGSSALSVYYDVGNSTQEGYEAAREIRWLGRKRICQIHLKDNPHYLGDGQVDFARVLQAIADIDYRGFANLETDSPSRVIEADLRRNLSYVRRVMADTRG